MNFGQAFTYQFQDPDWAKKIIIPALISLIPIIGQIFLLGWSLDITRRVIRRDITLLPDVDFGRHLSEGFKGFVAALVYSIPILIMTIPVTAVSMALGDGSNVDETMAAVSGFVSLCCGGLMFVYGLFMGFVLPAALGNMVAKESLGAAFRFQEIIALVRANPGAYLLVLVGAFLSSLIAQLGIIACGVGVFLTMAYAMSVNGHLYGQAYSEATRNSGFAQIY